MTTMSRHLLICVSVLLCAARLSARDVEGYVYDASGRPVAGAAISVFTPEPSSLRLQRILSTRPQRPALKEITTGSDGGFRFTGLPESVLEILTLGGGYAPSVSAHAPGQAPLTITLLNAAVVDGRVTAAGKPVAGATVTWVGANDLHLSLVTDTNGRYRAPDPAKWAHDAFVFHPEFAVTHGLRRVPDPRHELEMGVAVRGTVVHKDGSPAPNARIYVDGLPLGTSDADGQFSLRARASDRFIDAHAGNEIGSASLPAESLIITLMDGRRLDGTVRVGTTPLAGVTVSLHRHDAQTYRQLTVISDAAGRFTARPLLPGKYSVFLALPPGPALLMAGHDRMIEEGKDPNVVDLRTATAGSHDIQLVRLSQITGRVVDSDGNPVQGVEVAAVPVGQPALHSFGDPSTLVRTSAAGTFTLNQSYFDLPQQFHVVATKAGYGFYRSEPFAFQATGNRPVTVVFGGGAEVHGRVVNEEGEPVAGAAVAFASAEELAGLRDVPMLFEQQFQRRIVRTSASGDFIVHVPEGIYDFAVQSEGYQLANVTEREIGRGGEQLTVELKRGATIRGRVVRGDAGVEGVRISVSGMRGMRGDAAEVTRADGSFEITSLTPGKHEVMFYKHEEMIAETRSVEAPGTVTVQLPLTGTVRGRVLIADTGEPVSQFMVEVEPGTGEGRMMETTRSARMNRDMGSVDGRFEMTLPEGRQVLIVGAPGFGSGETVEVNVVAGEVREVEVRLTPGATLSGRVRDDAGNPVVDAQVMLVPDERKMRGPTRTTRRFGMANAQTDENGLFTLRGAEPGPALLNVRKQGYLPFQKEIIAGSIESMDIDVSRGITVTGVVLRDTQPVAGADVGASSPAVGSEHQGTTTDENGRFSLSGLMPATYTFFAMKDGTGHTEKRIDVSSERRITINLDERATGVVYGHVRGVPQGSGKVFRRVVTAASDRGAAEGMIRDDGSYRVENVPAGTVRLTAVMESRDEGRMSAVKSVEVRQGAELRVDLEFSEAARVSGQVTMEGRPVDLARVVFVTSNGANVSDMTRNGAYEVSLPSLGNYRVFVHSSEAGNRGYQAVHTIDGSKRIDIELREEIIQGLVLDAVTRRPISGAVVTLFAPSDPEPGMFGESFTGADGRFQIRTGASAQLRLSASAQGYGQQSMPLLPGSGTRDLLLELSPAGESRIRVVDARTGTPLEASVTFADESGAFTAARVERAFDGTLTVTLTPGRYLVTAWVAGFGTARVPFNAPGAIDIAVGSLP